MGKGQITGIYKIADTINNKVYIGGALDIKNRWGIHKIAFEKRTNNKGLQAVYDEHGIEAFSFEIIEECKSRELRKREGFYINHYDSRNPSNGYNIANATGKHSLNYGFDPEPISTPKQYITLTEIMSLYKCSKSTVYNWIDEGLPLHKFGRMTRFIESEVEKWLKEGKK